MCETDVPTWQVYRAFDEMLTDRMVRDDLPEYWAEIERSGVDVLSVSIGAWGERMFGLDAALCDLAQWDRRFREVHRLQRIEGPDDLHTAVREGRTGILLGFQNSLADCRTRKVVPETATTPPAVSCSSPVPRCTPGSRPASSTTSSDRPDDPPEVMASGFRCVCACRARATLAAGHGDDGRVATAQAGGHVRCARCCRCYG